MKKVIQKILYKISKIIPFEKGTINPYLACVVDDFTVGYLKPELLAFMSGVPEQFTTYGMTYEERKSATISLNSERKLVNDSREVCNVEKRIYIITKDGRLIVQPNHLTDIEFNHSSILKDEAVLCAGHITIVDGEITHINNNSGHYTPYPFHLYNALERFKEFYPGCLISEELVVELYDKDECPRSLPYADFKSNMENIADGETIPKFKKDAESYAESISEKGKYIIPRKILYTDGDFVEQLRSISNHFPKTLTTFNVKKAMITPEYQEYYRAKHDIPRESFKSITFTPLELIFYLAEINAREVLTHVISMGICDITNTTKLAERFDLTTNEAKEMILELCTGRVREALGESNVDHTA